MMMVEMMMVVKVVVVVTMCDLQRYRNTQKHTSGIIVRQTIIFDTGERARRKYSVLSSDLILTSLARTLSNYY